MVGITTYVTRLGWRVRAAYISEVGHRSVGSADRSSVVCGADRHEVGKKVEALKQEEQYKQEGRQANASCLLCDACLDRKLCARDARATATCAAGAGVLAAAAQLGLPRLPVEKRTRHSEEYHFAESQGNSSHRPRVPMDKQTSP